MEDDEMDNDALQDASADILDGASRQDAAAGKDDAEKDDAERDAVEDASLFPSGRVVATPGALGALTAAGITPWSLLARHLRGDWGDLDGHDRRENERALAQGRRLLSSYTVAEGNRVWAITEADRSATTLLLPAE